MSLETHSVAFTAPTWEPATVDLFTITVTFLIETGAESCTVTIDDDTVTVVAAETLRSVFETLASLAQAFGEVDTCFLDWPGTQRYTNTPTGGAAPLPVATHNAKLAAVTVLNNVDSD